MGFAVVVVLHGNETLPQWLTDIGNRRAIVIRNDEVSQRVDVPGANIVVCDNVEPRGFAHNINVGIDLAMRTWSPDAVVVANFDLRMSVDTVDDIVRILAESESAACAAVLSDSYGRPIFSSGAFVRPLSELMRAAGLRGRKMIHLQRALLRALPSWRRRNRASSTRCRYRTVPSGEYLPWTLIGLASQWWLTIGNLDERFFMYAEDVDWSIRAHQAGGRLMLADVGPVVHLERVTANRFVDSQYEASQLRLHRKWGFRRALVWQEVGLVIRRYSLLRLVRPGIDWSIIDEARAEAAVRGDST